MTPLAKTEHTDFPTAGYRARRWTRFERDLYEWLNRPEGQFECWLAERKLAAAQGAAQGPVAAGHESGSASSA